MPALVKAPECCLGGHPHCSEVAHGWGMTESVRQSDARGTLAELVKESSRGEAELGGWPNPLIVGLLQVLKCLQGWCLSPTPSSRTEWASPGYEPQCPSSPWS